MSQKEIKTKGNLLSDNGVLKDVGYSKKPILTFNKQKTRKIARLKEWDTYVIMDGNFALCITIANLSYASLIKASLTDFRENKTYSKISKCLSPKEKVLMSEDANAGISVCTTKNAEFRFETKNGERFLTGFFKNFYNNSEYKGDLVFEIKVFGEQKECICNAKSFKNKNHFLYTQKNIGLKAEGKVNIHNKTYVFDDQLTTVSYCFARGVLPYSTKWYWATMQGRTLDGKFIGINIGDIIDDDEESSENVVLYNNEIHKLDSAKIYIQHEGMKTNYLGAWTFYSNDGRLELSFEPKTEEKVGVCLGLIKHNPHRVYGYFSGKVILDNGEEVTIEHIIGVTSRIENLW